MKDCYPVKTPLDINQMLTKEMEPKNAEKKNVKKEEMRDIPYREAVGCLMYAYEGTRPDLGCAVTTLGSYAQNSGKTHWSAMKRTLRYLKGTMDLKLKFDGSKPLELVGYCDAN